MLIEEADHELTDRAFRQEPNLQGLYVEFYSMTARDDARTKEEGRPCFKEVDMIRCHMAGDRGSVYERPVRHDDKRKFSREWQAYKSGKEAKPQGIPLDEWSAVDKSFVEELKFYKIYTVEQLAEVADVHTSKIPMLQQYKQKAQAYLRALKEEAPLIRMQNELEERDYKIKELSERLAKLEKSK